MTVPTQANRTLGKVMGTTAVETGMETTKAMAVGPETGTGTTMAMETVMVMEQETRVLEQGVHLAAVQPLAVVEPQVLLAPAVVCQRRHLMTLGQLVVQVRPVQVVLQSRPRRATEAARVLPSIRAIRMVQ